MSATVPRTLIMGIVNVTPDSFSDGGRFAAADAAIAHGVLLASQGADWVDVGGESTRPGAERVDPATELERVLRVVRELAAAGIAVSIDTMNASTARAAVEAGARLVNDVSGALADSEMLAVVADSAADIALGHWRGLSSDMYARAHYGDVAAEVTGELLERVAATRLAGIEASRIVLDPGIGFAKNAEQNWAMLGGLPALVATGHRVLVGTSRKGFLGALIGELPASADEQGERDLATATTSALAARDGAWAVRVHDVRSTRIALAVAGAWQSGIGVNHPEEHPHGQA